MIVYYLFLPSYDICDWLFPTAKLQALPSFQSSHEEASTAAAILAHPRVRQQSRSTGTKVRTLVTLDR